MGSPLSQPFENKLTAYGRSVPFSESQSVKGESLLNSANRIYVRPVTDKSKYIVTVSIRNNSFHIQPFT